MPRFAFRPVAACLPLSVGTNQSKRESYWSCSVPRASIAFHGQDFLLWRLVGRLGILRAVIPVADLSGVLSQENPKYVGKSFPKIKQTGPSCTVIEVVPEEMHGQWRVGFYRAAKGALEFEDRLRAF
jgi:hypothetical protein